MVKRPQLEELATPFPPGLVKKAPKGKYGDYVPHSAVTERLLSVCGPFHQRIVREIYDDGVLTGVVLRIDVNIDGQWIRVDEAGDVENPTSKKTNGARLKDAVSDAVKRCAMRVGCGLHLWAQEDYFLDRQLAADDPALSSPALAPQPETPPVSVAPTPTRGESPVTIGPGDDGDVIFGEVGDVEASPGPIIPPTPEHVLGEGVTEADTIPVIKQWIHALYDSMAYAGIWGADALEKHLAAQMLRLELEEVPKPAGKPRFAIGDLRRKENMLTFAVNARRAAVRDLVRDVSDE